MSAKFKRKKRNRSIDQLNNPLRLPLTHDTRHSNNSIIA